MQFPQLGRMYFLDEIVVVQMVSAVVVNFHIMQLEAMITCVLGILIQIQITAKRFKFKNISNT